MKLIATTVTSEALARVPAKEGRSQQVIQRNRKKGEGRAAVDARKREEEENSGYPTADQEEEEEEEEEEEGLEEEVEEGGPSEYT